ncbi:hypothetical protein [Polyangium spumosum]|uniref:Disintegrin domain-containing protein n=1 Tax=Polyangium spumosum TaxID=889282 RepID=A0A6N7PGU9_9BACT|nr:hypothetical protein [Polyangium spumosum]MRG91258.1 hypothetical protein [Polyangium spumosum]
MPRPRLFSTLLAAAFVASALVQATSCALQTDGSKPVVDTVPCETAANCNDNNACTVDTCGDAKICVFTPTMDGPNPAQTAGDCKRLDCAGGEEVLVNDADDIPDDNEPCTVDACVSGAASNIPVADGDACQRGNQTGRCEAGVCQIACDAQTPCDDDNPCTDDFCNFGTSTCVFTNLDGLPTPGVTQSPGDCKQKLCVNGKDTDVTDDTDVPVDVNPCTDNVCTSGVPSNPSTASGTYCAPGMPEVCDGGGSCVQCTLPEHCTGIVETDCAKRACVNNQCVVTYLGNETTAGPASQMPGDCKRAVCNGVDGGTVLVNDDNDKPNDNNPCTIDFCTNGQADSDPAALNTNCGGSNVCNGEGQCVGCTSAGQCPGTDDFCKTRTCNGGVCGFNYKADGTETPGQTSGDCKVEVCDGAGQFVIRPDTMDFGDDGNPCTKNQCTAQGNNSYPNESFGFTCNVNGGDICNGNGQCKKSSGKNCSANGECANSICADAVCCNSTCGNSCQACNVSGSLGTCTNVPTGQDDAPTCTGDANSCNGSGQCRKEQGVSCSANNDCLSGSCVDGVCCENACTGTCKACNVAENVGKCVNVPGGQTDNVPANACTGANQCDGSGNCRKVTGQGCGNNNECVSGFCVDGVCCADGCAGTCMACNIAPNLGMCVNVPTGQEDGACSGTQACAGGVCKTKNGETCPAMESDCLSGVCADNVCCENACTGTCMACNVSGDEGKCINVPAGQDDDNGAMMCTGPTQSCDGNGACKQDDGTVCSADSQCESNHCVDSVCCESACDTACYQCNNSSSLGQCVAIAQMSDDTFPANICTGTMTCDGSGTCKLDNGEDCATNSDCASNKCPGGMTCQP